MSCRCLEHGFVGHLDAPVPDLIRDDDMDRRDRLSLQVTRKALGVVGMAVLCGPCELRTAVEGTTVCIAETTVYPLELN